MAQDDYYYEIQLTNKQLVFYFVAGAMGLILSFLAGVMVGRGVDASSGEVQGVARAAQTIHEDKVIPEPPRPASPPAAVEMDYSKLDQDRAESKLLKAPSADAAVPAKPGADKPASVKPVEKPAAVPEPAAPKPSAPPTVRAAAPSPAPIRSTPAPKPSVTAAAQSPGGAFTVQVGAFKEKPAADSIASRLKTKGFAAYVAAGAGGLFNVRVGSYNARTDAERVSAKLRDEEKFKPFIVPK